MPDLKLITSSFSPEAREGTGQNLSQDPVADFSEQEASENPFGPVPEPPEWMSYESKCEWLRSAPSLHEKGRLSGSVISMLESYCIAIGIVRECEAMIAVDGKIVGGKTHPAFRMMMESMKEARGIAVELRFAREGVPQGDKAKANGWDSGLLA